VRAGIEAPIYAHHFDRHHAAICQPLDAYAPRRHDLLLFHYTTWTPAADRLLELGRPLILNYHNVTPPEFFAGLDAESEAATRRGRDELGRFAPICQLAVANTEYSRADLVRAGFAQTDVLPVRVDFEALDRACDQTLLRDLRRGPPSVLTVGRVVPNKRIEDVIKAFAYYRRAEPSARLYCVGSHDERGPYMGRLRWLIRRLGLRAAVTFTGQVSNEQRGAYYRGCRVYLTMSEHEGFCAPVVEAMHLGQPVVGFASSAVPETMGGAGVLVAQKRHDVIGEAIALLAAETPLRARLVARGHAQARRYTAEVVETRFAALLDNVNDEG
jgi:L-malate glycosyltransferase